MSIRHIFRPVFPAIFFLFLLGGNAFSQQNVYYNIEGRRNVVSTAVPFLMITPDSRSGALADAGVALPSDVNAIHWNPARLAFTDDKIGLGISYVPWLRSLVPDINLSYLSFFSKIDNMSTFGMSLRYFSLGDITFTNDKGEVLMENYRPYELALDGAYARKLSDNFSLGLALRFIYSNLTGGTPVNGITETKPGIAFAGDLSAFYKAKEFKLFKKDFTWNLGLNISNLGSKITYTDETDRDFIPINLKLGTWINCKIDDYNEIALLVDFNKLLVPSAPVYEVDSSGNPVFDQAGVQRIYKGKNPDQPVIEGVLQSFSDAPGGFKEEIREINPSVAVEYWYNKQFAARAGYFYEHPTKGNRQYITLGLGIKYNILDLDVSYLIPTTAKTASQSSPLQNTLRFTLTFAFGKEKESKKNKKVK
jgi:hypothetical protein